MDCIKNPNGVKVVRKTLAFCRHLTPEQFHIEDNFCYFEEDGICKHTWFENLDDKPCRKHIITLQQSDISELVSLFEEADWFVENKVPVVVL